ncbi:MAG: 8-amino-7-oxononanoate synthase/2-amino-3-ketobutyrate coenzyme A ligase [Chloroflexi bacterium]|nr:8-amino-7-oxononanoate synthase/2-amino-3-ketobutyrate coenzyme A ligase [Chloroflexota bacterium]
MPVECNPFAFLSRHLEVLKGKNLYRHLRTVESAQDSWVTLEGRKVLNLCSNNYLGMASHPDVKEAAVQGTREWGCGTGASRLICGNFSFHRVLERRLAAFKGTEAALLYSSGYTANLGVISALAGSEDCIFSDELNHASIIDGCRLSQARVLVFPHNDLEALEDKLRRASRSGRARWKLIVVDGVFSMDGDIAPLPELVNLAAKYESFLMVDEAHAIGVLGPGGRGVVALFGLEKVVPVGISTLSKSLGSLGGFVTGSQELVEFLINTSRSFIFTTALPAGVVASALAALDLLEADPSLPLKVQENARYLRDGLNRLGYNTLNSQTQIIPAVIGDTALTLQMSHLLLNEGVLAAAIRPPTVSKGTCRIRTAVMATHTRQDLDFALGAFEEAGRRLAII